MLTVTPPLAYTADAVWVLVTADTGAVDAARMAYLPGSECFIAMPSDVFDTTGALPTYRYNGELVAGFRWANTSDMAEHAELFTEPHTE